MQTSSGAWNITVSVTMLDWVSVLQHRYYSMLFVKSSSKSMYCTARDVSDSGWAIACVLVCVCKLLSRRKCAVVTIVRCGYHRGFWLATLATISPPKLMVFKSMWARPLFRTQWFVRVQVDFWTQVRITGGVEQDVTADIHRASQVRISVGFVSAFV